MPVTRQLNLGCGNYPLEDHVNVDGDFRVRPQVICDLDRRPYPFPDGAFTRIFASHVLEHLRDPFAAMAEWHRLLAPGGELHVKVPHFSRGFTHPDHKRGFDVSFPLYFDERMPPWYVGTPFRLKRLRLHWNAQPYLKRYVASPVSCAVASALGFAIDTVANLHPILFSRLFTFWVGGFEEVEVVFERP
jgi:SAM-dependent methyltransferase